MYPARVTVRSSLSFARILERRPLSIHLELPELSPAENFEWERRICRYRSACGCGSGAAFMLASSAAYTALLISHSSLISSSLWPRIWMGAAFVAGATSLGKVGGLVFARVQLKRTVESLERMVSERVATDEYDGEENVIWEKAAMV